jgi:tRNA modification GTPase
MNYFSKNNDTICALSTANGIGAIAVIRVSGAQALAIVSAIFSKDLNVVATHTAHFGRIRNGEEIIDEVLLTVLHGGKSFTGEPTVEIACHGSTYIQQQILQLLIEQGCRTAQPGEFTMRAFMNGKMDLSQAEAVADLISSQSKRAHQVAMNQLRGSFSNELRDLREKLIHFASLVELELDFAEEDVEFADRTELKALVKEVLTYIQKLICSFDLGNALKNGVPVAIVGAPNTGKSTLLNQLLGEERAIVSDIAGTTRDVIEETLNIDGILFRLIDTAGIREGLSDSDSDKIEAIGIERSKQKIQQAQLVLVLADATRSDVQEVAHWASEIQANNADKHVLLVLNKTDVQQVTLTENVPSLSLSALTGAGISELSTWMVDQITQGVDIQQEVIVTNARHVEELQKTAVALQAASEGLENGTTGDFIAMDIRQGMYHLGNITGDISTDDLLGNIFSKFCIGK